MALGDGVRRNIAHVDPAERALLRDAFVELNNRRFPGSRTDAVPGGVTFWFKQDEIHQATHVHGGPEFLPWHREIVNRVEELLRQISPQLSLHYWDWTQDPRAIPGANVGGGATGTLNLFTPDFMGTGAPSPAAIGEPWLRAGYYVPNASPHRDGPGGNAADPPRSVARSVLGSPASPNDDFAVLAAGDYAAMRALLEDVHNRMHGFVAMGGQHISFRDPFVFLLHSNVDRLFALWQLDPAHPERLNPSTVYGSESNLDVVVGSATQNVNHMVEPWSTGHSFDQFGSEHFTRPWCAPENQGVSKTYKHPSVVTPPRYDTNPPRRNAADIVWHNSQTGETQIWWTDGERIAGRGTVLAENPSPVFVGPPFEIVGVGDVTGDGKADIVWHNSQSNETQIWGMDGHRIAGRATVVDENGQPAFVGLPFEIVGIGDVTGDGRADIVWHNRQTNETQIWSMNGHRIAGRATVVDENGQPIFVGPPFEIVGVGDVTGDGKADIVWHHSQTGETQIWTMNGHRIAGRATVIAESPSPALVGLPFEIVGVGDVTGDGKADIVWHNRQTNETQIWAMNGHRIAGRATVVDENGQPIFVGPPFEIVGIGDVTGDGKADIVWHHSGTGETQIWAMNGPRIAGRGTVVDENGQPIFVGPPFEIVGVGDVTGDGKADIVWHNSQTNETQIWAMNGHRIAGRATVVGENGQPAFVGPPFEIVGVGDVTGDGKADIVWHHSGTGETQIWRMDGHRIRGRASMIGENGQPAFVGPPFRIVGVGDVG